MTQGGRPLDPKLAQASRPPELPKRRTGREDRHVSDEQAEYARRIQRNSEDLTFNKNDIIIAVMGITGAGKSTFISLLSNAEIKIGHGLQSCTTEVGVYYFEYQGRRVFLVDTPGFDDTNRSDSEVLKDVAFWLAAAYTRETKLAGIIYLHRICDVRMQGSGLRNLRMFKQLCGENNLQSVILTTTHWTNSEGTSVPEALGQARIKELVETEAFWAGMVGRGSKVVKHDGSKLSAMRIISDLVDRKIRVTLDIQRQLIDEGRSLFNTDAGQALQTELIEERRKFEKKMSHLKGDMEEAMQEKDEMWKKQIEEDQAKYQASIKKTYEETNALRTDIKKIAEEKDAQYRALQAEMARERQRYEECLAQSNKELKAVREEQIRAKEEARRKKAEDDEKIARQAHEHQKAMTAMETRIRETHSEATRQQIEQERKKNQFRYEQERERAEAASRAQERRWEEQQGQYRQREARLEQERFEFQQITEKLEKESKKSKGFYLGAVTAIAKVVGLAVNLGLLGL